jgi:hypothetical protein
MRNTRGPAQYQGDWGKSDFARWTTENKALIPFGLNLTHADVYNLGFFALPLSELYNGACLATVTIAHTKEGY